MEFRVNDSSGPTGLDDGLVGAVGAVEPLGLGLAEVVPGLVTVGRALDVLRVGVGVRVGTANPVGFGLLPGAGEPAG